MKKDNNSTRNIKLRYYSWMFIAFVIMVVAYFIESITHDYLLMFIFLLVSFTCFIWAFIKFFFRKKENVDEDK